MLLIIAMYVRLKHKRKINFCTEFERCIENQVAHIKQRKQNEKSAALVNELEVLEEISMHVCPLKSRL